MGVLTYLLKLYNIMLGNKYLFWLGTICVIGGAALLAYKYFVVGFIGIGLGFIIAQYQDSRKAKK